MTDVYPWLTRAENHLTRFQEARRGEGESVKGKERQSSQNNTITRHNVHLQGQDRTNGRGHTKIKAVAPPETG